MSDFISHEVVDVYVSENNRHYAELNKLIVELRTRIAFLEHELEERNKLPVPPTVIRQVSDLQEENRKLKEDLDYFKSLLPESVVINRQSKIKATRRGGLK